MTMKRADIVIQMHNSGIIPLFYHKDRETCKQVISACYRGGMRVFEFTNRGEFAHEVFSELSKWSLKELPGLVLGAGTVVDPGTCSLYIQLGAKFIVSPILNDEMATVCNRRKILWIPGCGTSSEINRAEALGAEIVKIFPAPSAGGPGFIKAHLGPCPWSSLMPSGGVSPTEENLRQWFDAGACCVGMGSKLVKAELIRDNAWDTLEKNCREVLAMAERIKNEKHGV